MNITKDQKSKIKENVRLMSLDKSRYQSLININEEYSQILNMKANQELQEYLEHLKLRVTQLNDSIVDLSKFLN